MKRRVRLKIGKSADRTWSPRISGVYRRQSLHGLKMKLHPQHPAPQHLQPFLRSPRSPPFLPATPRHPLVHQRDVNFVLAARTIQLNRPDPLFRSSIEGPRDRLMRVFYSIAGCARSLLTPSVSFVRVTTRHRYIDIGRVTKVNTAISYLVDWRLFRIDDLSKERGNGRWSVVGYW